MEKSIRVLDLGVDEFGERVMDQVKAYMKALGERGISLRSVVVFGSRARGDYKPWSDADVLVIAENLPIVKRWETLWIGEVEPRGYTPREFMRALLSLDMTALDACCEGKVVYDDGFWELALKEFEKVKEIYELTKLEDAWEIGRFPHALKA